MSAWGFHEKHGFWAADFGGWVKDNAPKEIYIELHELTKDESTWSSGVEKFLTNGGSKCLLAAYVKWKLLGSPTCDE